MYFGLGKANQLATTVVDNDSEIEMRQLLVEQVSQDDDGAVYKSPEPNGGVIHQMWERVDEAYLKPVFGGNPRTPTNI